MDRGIASTQGHDEGSAELVEHVFGMKGYPDLPSVCTCVCFYLSHVHELCATEALRECVISVRRCISVVSDDSKRRRRWRRWHPYVILSYGCDEEFKGGGGRGPSFVTKPHALGVGRPITGGDLMI